MSYKAGSIGSAKTIKFSVIDDGDTSDTNSVNESGQYTLTISGIAPAVNDEALLKSFQVKDAVKEIARSMSSDGSIPLETITNNGEQVSQGIDINLDALAQAMNESAIDEFLSNHAKGIYKGKIDNAKKFFKHNAAPAEDLTLQKDALTGQLDGLDPASDDYKALEAKIAQLESTINKYDTLIPDINVLDDPDLLSADGSLDVERLLSTTQTKAAEIIDGGDGEEAKVSVKVGGAESVEISQEEFGELLAARNNSYGAAVAKGFESAEEGTAAQMRTVAAADLLGVSLTSNDPDAVAKAAQYDAMAAQFLEAGVSIADVFETADPELIERAKQLSQDEKAAAVATKAKETLQSMTSPFGGGVTIGAADIVNEATRIKRNLDGAEYFGEFDSLGTPELSKTNADYIGALDGNISGLAAGEDNVTFSVDSKAVVFEFKLDTDPTNSGELIINEQNYLKQKTEVISFLAGEANVYDEDGNLTPEAAEAEAGYDSSKYNKYLKYVSQADLKAYGAIATTETNNTGEVIFEWTGSINTDDGNPLTLLDGETVITTAGWYDFTQQQDDEGNYVGDGARYIQNESGRVVGVELNFTANMFGDKKPGDNKITDPGATVSVVSKGNGQLEENEVAVNENELTRLLAFDEESSESEEVALEMEVEVRVKYYHRT